MLSVSQILTFVGIGVFLYRAKHRANETNRPQSVREREAVWRAPSAAGAESLVLQVLLLPAYTWFFGLLLAQTLACSVVLSFLPGVPRWAPPDDNAESMTSSVLQGMVWGSSHVLIEGICVFLAQQGHQP